MELLTTHVGADFDALASVLVARRLFPEAEVFFPGSREESVRRMLAAGVVRFDELRQKEIDPGELRRVILCDCRQPDRLGVVADWLAARPAVEILAYDHHPDSPHDIATSGGRVDPGAGSTSTILVEELRSRGMTVPAEDATLLLLGIYEDTGSLSYPTAGARDLEAAAWLLRGGANLAAVRRFASRQLDEIHLEVLHRMTEALEIHRLRGHRIGVVALELGSYVNELAPLVSRCLELFELPLLFALFGETERVTVIARGEVAGFDLGSAMAAFAAGGGHATAAAGSIKGATTIEARERLLEFLPAVLPPVARAADLMVRSFLTVAAEETIADAKARIVEGKVNAAPVVEPDGRVAGIVTRQALDAALQHGLGERPVETAMSRDVEWVRPDAAADDLAEPLLGTRPRLVLVGDAENGRAEGVVSRMAVLRHLHGRVQAAADPAERRARAERGQRAQAGPLLAQLPPAARRRVDVAAEVSRRHGIPAFLVGGVVRDLLLGRETRDLDLVVEGDGLAFARLYAKALDGRAREHPAFLTAVVIDRDGVHVDLATARSEFYRAPAALPEVQTSALRQDLFRRDFTINTLAVRLGPETSPELIDFFGARRDLDEKTLRVLHSLSLIDDPTRVLRAVRLEARLGFHISAETRRLIGVALREGVFERLSGTRLREELYALLDEPASALRALERLDELELVGVLHPQLRLDAGTRARLRECQAAWDWLEVAGLPEPRVEPRRLLLLALVFALGEEATAGLADRLALAGHDRERLLEAVRRVLVAAEILDAAPPPHRVYRTLQPLHGEEILFLLAIGDEERRGRVRHYLTELQGLRLAVRGSDLLGHGVPAGPELGRALEVTLDARLDGRIPASAELEFALDVARRLSEAAILAGEPG
jgi:tRNA nucleotidyltransferase (CCA-adding enzyme)